MGEAAHLIVPDYFAREVLDACEWENSKQVLDEARGGKYCCKPQKDIRDSYLQHVNAFGAPRQQQLPAVQYVHNLHNPEPSWPI